MSSAPERPPHVARPAARVARLLAGVVAAVAAVLAGLTVTAGPTAAHAILVGVTPADGSTTRTAPARVVLRFDEGIRDPSVVVVTGPRGRADHGRTTVLDTTVTVPVSVTGPGRYTVAYRVLSVDGHPVSGRTTFTYRGAAGAGAPSSPSTAVPSSSHRGTGAAREASGPTVLIIALAVVVVLLIAAAGLLLVRRVPGARDTGEDHTGAADSRAAGSATADGTRSPQ
jgi:methionine-rich copper-binding protein CopC